MGVTGHEQGALDFSGTATSFLNGGAANTAAGGGVLFFDMANAGSAIFTVNPGHRS